MIEQPKHWLHAIATATIFAVPISQGLAYTASGAFLAIYLPLAVAIPLLIFIGVYRPRARLSRPPQLRFLTKFTLIFAAALACSFMLPPSNDVLIVRTGLIDFIALIVVAYATHGTRKWHPKNV